MTRNITVTVQTVINEETPIAMRCGRVDGEEEEVDDVVVVIVDELLLLLDFVEAVVVVPAHPPKKLS